MSAADPPLHAAGEYEIRAMSMAEILDASFQLVKNRFVLLAGFGLLGQVPSILLFSVYGWMLDPMALEQGSFPAFSAAFIIGIGVYVLGMILLMPFVVGAITGAIGDLYLGAEVTFETAARHGLARMIPLAITYIIFSIVNGAALLVVVGVFGGLAVAVGAALQGSGAVVAALAVVAVVIALPVFLGLAMLLAFMPGILAAVVVLERQALFQAVMRTWELVGSAFWRTMGIATTVYLIVLVAPTGVQFLVGAIPVVGAVVWGGVQAICQAYLFSTAVVVYFDMRCRKESFDLEHLAQMVEGDVRSAAPIL